MFEPRSMLMATILGALIPTSGLAYTPEQEQACSGDALRLCGPEIPDVERITACMIRNKSQLSPGCRAFFRPEPEDTAGMSAAAGRPLSIKPTTPQKPVSAKLRRKPVRPGPT
jgi:hypothetical protein